MKIRYKRPNPFGFYGDWEAAYQHLWSHVWLPKREPAFGDRSRGWAP